MTRLEMRLVYGRSLTSRHLNPPPHIHSLGHGQVRVSGGVGGLVVRLFSTTGPSPSPSPSSSSTSTSSVGGGSGAASPLGQLTAKTLLSLPPVNCDFHIVQTSTLGRFVSGGLDRSCFGVSGRVGMGPFTLVFNPRGVTTHLSPALAPSPSPSSSGGQGACVVCTSSGGWIVSASLSSPRGYLGWRRDGFLVDF